MSAPYVAIPLSQLRKVIAARMTQAKQTIPHFRLLADIELDALLAQRNALNAVNPELKISVNDCIIKACARALMRNNAVNIQLVESEVHQYRDADISVVVAVEGGLATPVIRAANRKTVIEISKEVRVLTARARAKQLSISEIIGGTFSVSNLGSYGVDQFDAIINPPQCAILAVARAKARVVVSEEGDIRVATVLRATLSVDHRVIDGAVGAQFMDALRQEIESPGAIFANNNCDAHPP